MNLTTRSLLPQISALRDGLSPAEIASWKLAAQAARQNWWNLFVQDTAYRLKYGIAGLAVPSELHQYKVGRIEIKTPAQRVLLTQYHPIKYYVSKKVRGATSLREDVAINEKFSLPLQIEISYRSSLAPVDSSSVAHFYAVVYSSYQGRTIETQVDIPFENVTGWQRLSANIDDVIGVARYYQLFIELDHVHGSFEWDNVAAWHNGVNWARDWRCTDVNNEITPVNFQIEASWEELFLPTGAEFASVYPNDNILP